MNTFSIFTVQCKLEMGVLVENLIMLYHFIKQPHGLMHIIQRFISVTIFFTYNDYRNSL